MEDTVTHLKFNQDSSYLGVGTNNGWSYHAFKESQSQSQNLSLEMVENMQVDNGGVRLMDRFSTSSLGALVVTSSPRKLHLINLATGNEIVHFFFSSSILAIRINKCRLVVLLEEKLYIYEVPEVKLNHSIRLDSPCPQGIMDLCLDSTNSLVAFPICNSAGIIQVYHTVTRNANYTIPAHTSSVAAIAFNNDGSLLATASEKGTIIRVFRTSSTNDGTRERVFEYRRGIMRSASIYSIAFCPDNLFLAVSSDTETIHIFKLQQPEDKHAEESEETWGSWLRAALPIPMQVNKMLYEERAFATITSPGAHPCKSGGSSSGSSGSGLPTRRNVLAFRKMSVGGGKPELRVLVASYDGRLYLYRMNLETGGVCPLLKQFTFVRSHQHQHQHRGNPRRGIRDRQPSFSGDSPDLGLGSGIPPSPSSGTGSSTGSGSRSRSRSTSLSRDDVSPGHGHGLGSGSSAGTGNGFGFGTGPSFGYGSSGSPSGGAVAGGMYTALSESALVPTANAVMGAALQGLAGVRYGVGLVHNILEDIRVGVVGGEASEGESTSATASASASTTSPQTQTVSEPEPNPKPQLQPTSEIKLNYEYESQPKPESKPEQEEEKEEVEVEEDLGPGPAAIFDVEQEEEEEATMTQSQSFLNHFQISF